VEIEVEGGKQELDDFKKYVLDRTNGVSVIATAARGPAVG
jgi:hypothetical protein